MLRATQPNQLYGIQNARIRFSRFDFGFSGRNEVVSTKAAQPSASAGSARSARPAQNYQSKFVRASNVQSSLFQFFYSEKKLNDPLRVTPNNGKYENPKNAKL